MTYQCRSRIQRAEAEVLAIHCSDHRVQLGLREFLDEAVGLRANYDLIAVPGGPQCLIELERLPKFAWASRKWARALIQMHALTRLILIAHQDCGWYQWLEQGEKAAGPIRRKQEEDLRAAERAAFQLDSGLAVDLFYAGWDDIGAITVDSVRG